MASGNMSPSEVKKVVDNLEVGPGHKASNTPSVKKGWQLGGGEGSPFKRGPNGGKSK